MIWNSYSIFRFMLLLEPQKCGNKMVATLVHMFETFLIYVVLLLSFFMYTFIG